MLLHSDSASDYVAHSELHQPKSWNAQIISEICRGILNIVVASSSLFLICFIW